MVTSTMISGLQHIAEMVGFQTPSGGEQAVKSSIEFNAPIRRVETMLNHKKRFRQTLSPMIRRMRMATEALPTAIPIMANGWHM